jgi:hypothetical protein
MSNPALLFAIAAISMSFAGFSSVFLALRPRDAGWQSWDVARVTAIVLFALTTLFGGLLIAPLASLIGETVALRTMSAVLLVLAFYLHQVRVGTAWLKWRQIQSFGSGRDAAISIAPFAFVALADQVLLLMTCIAPKLELYELALIAMLGTPALVFVVVVTGLDLPSRR